jgi:hypothetical protein
MPEAKSVTVLLRTGGNRVEVRAGDWTLSPEWVTLIGDDKKWVASFPKEAVAGLWKSDSGKELI